MHEAKMSAVTITLPLMIMASVVIVSVLGWLVKPVFRALILNPFRVREKGEVYRLLTAGWLHSNVSHLAFNMFSLYIFSETALRGLGPLRFVLLYISAAVIAFVP